MTDESFGAQSGLEFARTDLISNHTAFQDSASYAALLRNEALPVHALSSFMHEATHHWCFVSPLGKALSLLYLSVAKRALHWAATGDDALSQEAFDDLCAYELAVSWLRPLNEGLAQFAEYDVRLTVSTSHASPPLLATLNFLFNLPERIKGVPVDARFAAFYPVMDEIARWRLSPQVIDRKSELLLQPMHSAGSPYLLGYMTVKQLWKSAARFHAELEEADVFMMFLRKLVFGDVALAGALLDRTRNGRQRGLEFGRRLHERMSYIGSSQIGEIAWSDWQEVLDQRPLLESDRPGHDLADPLPFVLGATEAEVREADRLVRRLHVEVIHVDERQPLPGVADAVDAQADPAASQSIDDLFPPTYFFELLEQRYLMWLGTVPATWTSTASGIVQIAVDGEVVIDDFRLPPELPQPRPGDFTLDIFINMYELCLVASIVNDRQVVGLRFWGDIGEAARKQLRDRPMNPHVLARQTALVHQFIGSYVGGTDFRQMVQAFWSDGGRRLLDQTYLGLACNFDQAAEQALTERGLADVLQNDPDLVRAVAAISLGASAEMTPEYLASLCDDSLPDPRDTIRQLERLWPFERLPLASLDEDGFLASSV